MLRYECLSKDMAQRLMMLAVEHMTSTAIQALHTVSPIVQRCRSFTSARGITSAATRRSAMARETRNKLDSLWGRGA